MKANKLTISLIKSEITDFSEIVGSETEDIHEQQIDSNCSFFYTRSFISTPKWIANFFGNNLKEVESLFNASVRGLLLQRVTIGNHAAIFALTFGYGRTLLNPSHIEERFGLKIVLNSVDPDNLRSIDKKNLGSVPKHSREQIAVNGSTADFGLDIEQDLVQGVTGKSRIEGLGSTISGSDSFSTSVKTTLGELPIFLKLCYETFMSEEYKTDFGWIDQIEGIKNPEQKADLDAELSRRLSSGNRSKIWMAIPEIIPWDEIEGIYINPSQVNDADTDIHLDDLAEYMAGKGLELNIENIKKQTIYAKSSVSQTIANKWSAYKCMYAEIELDGDRYILSNAGWYKISTDFKDIVDQEFLRIEASDLVLPSYFEADQGEKNYNIRTAGLLPRGICADSKLIRYGGGRSSIEFCDLVTDKKLIHVKKYGGSSVLSHLFSQGLVSGELFFSDFNFREKLKEKLPELGLGEVRQNPNTSEYQVIFGIISSSSGPLDIPFFSKVTAKNVCRRLEGLGYHVHLNKISME